MKIKKYLAPALLFVIFLIYTSVIKLADVQAIGPLGSSVGLASVNGFFAHIFSYNDFFYKLTKIIALFSFMYIGGFALLGLIQLIKNKSLKKVDPAVYGMGATYIITILFYILFEVVVINYRPILEDGELEASFPSSHTMLAVAVFGSAIVYAVYRIKNSALKSTLAIASGVFAGMMAIGRMISGVHWFTDILGGVLLGLAITSLYLAFVQSLPDSALPDKKQK